MKKQHLFGNIWLLSHQSVSGPIDSAKQGGPAPRADLSGKMTIITDFTSPSSPIHFPPDSLCSSPGPPIAKEQEGTGSRWAIVNLL